MLRIRSATEAKTNKIKEPKSESGVRDIPIPDDFYGELSEHIAELGPFDYVFTQKRTGRRHTESSYSTAWDSLKEMIDGSMGAVYAKRKAKDGKMRKTKILSVVAEDFVPYCLRHTYCTDLQKKGVPINVAKYLMGHSKIELTAQIYTHMEVVAFKDAADKINAKKEHVMEKVMERKK